MTVEVYPIEKKRWHITDSLVVDTGHHKAEVASIHHISGGSYLNFDADECELLASILREAAAILRNPIHIEPYHD